MTTLETLNPIARYQLLADNILRDTSIMVRAPNGTWCHREYTPPLARASNHDEALQIASACTADGGGWQLASVDELVSRIDRPQRGPALSPDDPHRDLIKTDDWYWTRDTVASSSGGAWGVGFYYGSVYDSLRYRSGYVLACRLAPASQ